MTGRIVVFGLALLAATPSKADDATHFDGRIKVGATGIMCVKEPCPRIGVTAAWEPGKPRLGRSMFAGDAPPPMRGADADMAAVRAAWNIEGCLVLEGRFSRPPLLEIRRVVGPCGPQD